MRVQIDVNDTQVRSALARLVERAGDLRPALLEIGEELQESTLRRFQTSTGPDGARWPANSALTLLRSKRQAGKKPLIGETRALSTQIHYAVDGNVLVIGSPMKYAAMQHFGAKKGEFGRYYQLSRLKFSEGDFRRYAGMRQGHPIPWADIPARPFLGISVEDGEAITRTVLAHLGEPSSP